MLQFFKSTRLESEKERLFCSQYDARTATYSYVSCTEAIYSCIREGGIRWTMILSHISQDVLFGSFIQLVFLERLMQLVGEVVMGIMVMLTSKGLFFTFYWHPHPWVGHLDPDPIPGPEEMVSLLEY